MGVFEIALGVYYQSSYYVAKHPVYKAETVFFERFCYDFVSLFGVNILFLEIEQLELIIRQVYASVSYNFEGDGLRLRAPECVDPAFNEDDFNIIKNDLSQKNVKIDILTRRKRSEDDFADKVDQEKADAGSETN